MATPRLVILAATGLVVFAVAGERALALDLQITMVRAAPHHAPGVRVMKLRPRLRRLVGYRAYRLIHQERRTCVWQNREAFRLPGGLRVDVVPKRMRHEDVVMQVRLVEGARALVDADFRLRNRGVMLLGVADDAAPTQGPIIIMLQAGE